MLHVCFAIAFWFDSHLGDFFFFIFQKFRVSARVGLGLVLGLVLAIGLALGFRVQG